MVSFFSEKILLFVALSVYVKSEACKKKLKDHGIIPEYAPNSVSTNLKIIYDDTHEIDCGALVSIPIVEKSPNLTFDTNGKCDNVTFLFFDLDVLPPFGPIYLHWLVFNVPSQAVKSGSNGKDGDTVADYISPGSTTNDHRYTHCLYCQQHYLKPGKKITLNGRRHFDIQEFTSKKDLGDPIACKYFNGTALNPSDVGL